MRDMTPALRGGLDAAAPTDTILPLEVRGLVYERGGQRLIDGVDLALDEGPCTVVMGPNGAGKSLLLRLLHGLLEPSAGRVSWAGRAAGSREVTRRQAMVFQRPVLLRRSAAANVNYAMRVHGVAGAERRARLTAVLDAARLTHLARRPARVLSGGEQQRLVIARALSIRPEVLFLDEPTANLDPASTLAVEELIQRARRAGTTLVLVTHDLGQARRLADEVVFMHLGRVVEQTAASRFFERPTSDAARAYLEGRLLL
jgi:tungstate transport system ATP-binding protein